MSAEFFTVSERLLGATANGLYQGVAVTVIAALALRFLIRTNAATRHAVWFGVLMLVAALIPLHVVVSCLSHSRIPEANPTFSAPIHSPPAPAYSGNDADVPVLEYGLLDPLPDEPDPAGFEVSPPFHVDGAPDAVASIQDVLPSGPGIVPPESLTPPGLFVNFHLSAWKLDTAINLPRTVSLCLIAAWILLATLRGGMIAARLVEVRRLKRTSASPSPLLQSLFDRLRSSLASRRNVRLKISTAHPTAVLLGFVNPAVLLPAEMDNNPDDTEVEHVLRHELAHVARCDDWVNLAQQGIQAALFFHPAVWWISAKLSLEREIACDDHVLDAGDRPRAYALTLANVACRMSQCRQSLSPGVSNNNSQLQQRITMILNTHRDRSPRLARSRAGILTAAAATLAIFAITAGPRLVVAEEPSSDEASEAAEASEATEATLATSEQPPAPEVLIADAAPAASPNWSESESGPRPKAPVASDDSTQQPAPPEDAPPAPAAPAIAVMTGVEPIPPTAPNAPRVLVAPVGPRVRVVEWSEKKHGSIEERLDRIERILDELQARDGKGRRRGGDGMSYSEDSKHPDGKGDMAMNFKMDFDMQRTAEAAQRAAEQAQRAVEASQRSVEQGQRAAEKVAREFEEKSRNFERMNMNEDKRRAEADGPRMELQALRAARESLQSEVKNLERQIKHLEEERDGLKKKGRSDDSDGDSKGEKPSPGPEKP